MKKIFLKENPHSLLLIAAIFPVLLLLKKEFLWFSILEVIFVVSMGVSFKLSATINNIVYFRPCLINTTGIILAYLVYRYPSYANVFVSGWLLIFLGALALVGKSSVKP